MLELYAGDMKLIEISGFPVLVLKTRVVWNIKRCFTFWPLDTEGKVRKRDVEAYEPRTARLYPQFAHKKG